MIAINTRNLKRTYGDLVAVNNLDLKVPEKTLYGLIGPNGAGKTTTLRMLAGLLEPTSGEIRIHELPIRSYWRDIQFQIGYMPDFFGVYDDLLVWEYLEFFARCYKLSPQRRTIVVDELLQLVGLEKKRNVYVQTLSRGMRQRLCLAHALVHDPSVLLLDEPASGLDPRARVEMREVLRELRSMGKTILLSSHILTELAELCDMIGILETGRLVASGPLQEIRHNLSNQRTYRLHLLSEKSQAESILEKFKQVENISHPQVPSDPASDHLLDISFSGDELAAAQLLENLILQGVRLSSFGELPADLEDIYLQLTNGEVS